MKSITIKDFSVGYFPPWDKYYISNGREVYLDSRGEMGQVYYYNTKQAAENALKQFIKESK